MPVTKRLLVKASSSYDAGFKIVPVNTNKPIEIESDLGIFSLVVTLKNFDGSNPHLSNSLYNVGDKAFLNGEAIDSSVKDVDELGRTVLPNLRLEIDFQPKAEIKGSEFLWGNDFSVPIKQYVPATLLSTGLKLFTWFVNKTVKGDVYSDKPYLYALALNSMTYFAIKNKTDDPENAGKLLNPDKKHTDLCNFTENLSDNGDNLEVPDNSFARKTFFNSADHCAKLTLKPNNSYSMMFETSYLKTGDSKYAASIPTYGTKSFDIDVSHYANEKLNNFNWILKQGGYDGVGHGNLGLVVNFALVDEDREN